GAERSTLPMATVQDLCGVDEHPRERERTGRSPPELAQRSALGSDKGDIKNDSLIGAFVGRIECRFDEIGKSVSPSLPAVLYLMRPIARQRAQIFPVGENSRSLQLLVIGMVLIRHDVHGHG